MTDKGPSGEEPNAKEKSTTRIDPAYGFVIPDEWNAPQNFNAARPNTWGHVPRDAIKAAIEEHIKSPGDGGKAVVNELTKHAGGEQPQVPTDRPVDEKGRAHEPREAGLTASPSRANPTPLTPLDVRLNILENQLIRIEAKIDGVARAMIAAQS